MPPIHYRLATSADVDALCRLRHKLFPNAPEYEHAPEIQEQLDASDLDILVAETEGRCIGFLEVSVRKYAEGSNGTPVGYNEGWFVEESFRRQGIGRELVEQAEKWTRDRGLTQFGSDADFDNNLSHQAHLALGFRETGRIVCYLKDLG